MALMYLNLLLRPAFLFIFVPVLFFADPRGSFAASADEARIIMQLQREIAPETGESIFYLKNGDKVRGVQLEEGAEQIKVKQFFGYSGSMVSTLKRSDVLRIEPVSAAEADITGEEIKIKKELPGFHFSRSGIYSFFTDQDYFKVTKSVELLQRLNSGFLVTFGPLIDNVLTRRNYVIIFKTPKEYDAYKQKMAPYLKIAAGFYDVVNNQLVFYDFFNSQDYAQIDSFVKEESRKIEDLKAENTRYRDSNYEIYQNNLTAIRNYEQSLAAYSSRLALQARDVNIRILRHEASHQLTFDLMLSGKAENFDTWLLEGLAEYCSTPSIGERNSEYIRVFRDALAAGSAIPLRELFSYSKDNRFYTIDELNQGLAYAESWALFYFLMQPQWRERFFGYWEGLKTADKVTDLDERIKFAEDNLDVSLDDLQRQLHAFIITK